MSGASIGLNSLVGGSIGDTALKGIAVGDTLVWSPLGVEVVGAISDHGNSVPLPAHEPGDMIVVWAISSATLPSKAAAGGTVPTWLDITNTGFTGAIGSRLVYCVATTSTHTTGSWVNAQVMTAAVLKGQGVTPIGGNASSHAFSGSNPQAPAVVLVNTDGSSALLHFHGKVQGSLAAAPAGYTRVAQNEGSAVILNTKDDSSTDGAIVQPGTTSAMWSCATLEVRAY